MAGRGLSEADGHPQEEKIPPLHDVRVIIDTGALRRYADIWDKLGREYAYASQDVAGIVGGAGPHPQLTEVTDLLRSARDTLGNAAEALTAEGRRLQERAQTIELAEWGKIPDWGRYFVRIEAGGKPPTRIRGQAIDNTYMRVQSYTEQHLPRDDAQPWMVVHTKTDEALGIQHYNAKVDDWASGLGLLATPAGTAVSGGVTLGASALGDRLKQGGDYDRLAFVSELAGVYAGEQEFGSDGKLHYTRQPAEAARVSRDIVEDRRSAGLQFGRDGSVVDLDETQYRPTPVQASQRFHFGASPTELEPKAAPPPPPPPPATQCVQP